MYSTSKSNILTNYVLLVVQKTASNSTSLFHSFANMQFLSWDQCTVVTVMAEKKQKLSFLSKDLKFCINLLLKPATCKIGMQHCEKNKEAKLGILELACPKKFIVFIK